MQRLGATVRRHRRRRTRHKQQKTNREAELTQANKRLLQDKRLQLDIEHLEIVKIATKKEYQTQNSTWWKSEQEIFKLNEQMKRHGKQNKIGIGTNLRNNER